MTQMKAVQSPEAQALTHATPLYEIVLMAQEIERQIAAAGGELTEETETALLQVDLAVATKIDAYAYIEDHMAKAEEFWKDQAQAAAKVAKSLAAAQERLTARIKEAMIAMQKTEVQGVTRRYQLSANKGSLKVNEALLPKEYLIVETVYRQDKERIKADLLALKEIPGASIEGGYTLRKYAARKA